MTLDFFEKLEANTRALPDHVAFQILDGAERETFTYERITNEVSRLSNYLSRKGVRGGQTVGILMENHPTWGIAFLAAQSVGARIVPFDILHHPDTLAGLIRHSGCGFLIASSETLPKLQEIQRLLPEPLPAMIRGKAMEGYDRWEQILEEYDPADSIPMVERDLDETLLIVYTSGTTGNPKGVMLSRRNLYQTVVSVLEQIAVVPQDHFLSVLPLYHMLALMTSFITPLYTGSTVTFVTTLEPQKILHAFRDEGITIFVCVPQFYYVLHRRILQEIEKQSFVKRFLIKRLLRISRFCNRNLNWNPGRLFFSKIHSQFGEVRLHGVGGARFDPEILESFYYLGFNIVQAYGMTETSAISTLAPQGMKGLGSVGRPLPHVEIKIDRPDSSGVGEVLIRGPNIMQGYWENPEATAEVLVDGWLHSGDLGYLDPRSLLHITGRTKDVIVLSSGKNIYPEEIEQAYERRCPFIKEMCVVGIPDTSSDEEQEILHAVIVPDFDYMRSQKVVNAGDMIRYLMENISQQLPPHKRVRSFEIRREPLPRTTTRKIKRFEVEKELHQLTPETDRQRFTEASTPESPLEEKVFDLARNAGKLTLVHRDMSLELDLGLDSLERVEFLSNVQDAFNIHFSDDEAVEIFTLKDLVRSAERHLAEDAGAGTDLLQLSWKEILSKPLRREEEEQIHKILRRRPITELVYYLLTRIMCRLPSRALLRMKIIGQDNLPEYYPYMICPNHLSFIDGFLLAGALPLRTIRRLFFLGYSDYFGTGIMSFLGSLIKVVPVDPDRNLRQALRLGAHGIMENLILAIFPEGERSIDGTLKSFKKGPAILATELQVPVVPVAIKGSYEVWRRGSNQIRLHPVTIEFGEPLIPNGGKETSEEFNERLRAAVAALFEPDQ